MTDLRAIRLVFWREVTERLRTRSFQVMTVIIALLSLGGSIWFGIPRTTVHRLAVVGEIPSGLVDVARHMAGERRRTRIDVTAVASEADGRDQLRAGRVDAVALDASHALVDESEDQRTGLLVLEALRRADVAQRLVRAGAPTAEALRLVHPPRTDVHITVLRPTAFTVRGGVAALGVVASALFLVLYGMWIAQGIIQETSSGVSNIMVATCEPTNFVVGKTLGIGAVALLQVVLSSLPSGVLLLARSGEFPFSPWLLPMAAMWFVLAFAIYGYLFAAVAAHARKIEKMAGKSILVNAPLTLLAYLGVLSATLDPEGSLAAVLSFFPFSAPFTMPVRSIATELPWWEVPVAAALAALTAVAVARFSAAVYLRGLAKP